MNEPIETIPFEKDGEKRRILIKYDPGSNSPREDFDPLGTMVCWGRYGYSDLERNHWRYASDFEESWNGEEDDDTFKDAIRLPISYHSHSGIRYWAGTPDDPWDSGQCGWIFITRKDIIDHWGTEPDSEGVTPDERAITCMKFEIEEFSNWASGNIYGWCVERFIPACDHGHGDEWVEVDDDVGHWGFIGSWPTYGGVIEDACMECEITVPDEFKERKAAAA